MVYSLFHQDEFILLGIAYKPYFRYNNTPLKLWN